jgi:hypothetical protein
MDLSRDDLHRMLAHAGTSDTVAFPVDAFCDVVTLAHKVAATQSRPPFTLRQLETLLFDCANQGMVHFDAGEFSILAKLALQSISLRCVAP